MIGPPDDFASFRRRIRSAAEKYSRSWRDLSGERGMRWCEGRITASDVPADGKVERGRAQTTVPPVTQFPCGSFQSTVACEMPPSSRGAPIPVDAPSQQRLRIFK